MIEQGREITTLINKDELQQPDLFMGTCHVMEIRERTFDIIEGKYDTDIIFYNQ